MNQKTTIIKDASAVILTKDDKVFLAQRNPKIPFLGGWNAFAGGKVEAQDAEIEVRNVETKDIAKFIATAVRETFEEIGVLIVRNGEKLTKGQRASLHDDLMSGRSTFAEILDSWGLWIDAGDFQSTGFWTTPPFSSVRFKTRFFLAKCPLKQEPNIFGEFTAGGWTTAKDALKRWEHSEILISPPVLISLQELENSSSASLRLCGENLLEKSEKFDGQIDFVEFNSRLICFPLKTETLPPATHTNCFIVGKQEFIVIDAASSEKDEQAKLHKLIDSFIEKGFTCKEIIVSHLHQDHFGGETALQKHLQAKFNLKIPISAHKLTAESLSGKVEFQRFIEDNEVFELKDENGVNFNITALHTRGHARGHLAFYDEEFGFLLSSDNVVSTGSVLIAPPEGNMTDYLQSLERLKNLPNLRFLCGSHGAAIFDAKGKIESYIAHRLEREKKIIEAIENGTNNVKEIVAKVYTDISPALYQLAELSVQAHLEKIRAEKI